MSGDTGSPPDAGAPAPTSLSRYRSRRQPQTQKQQQQQSETPSEDMPTIPSRYRHRSASLSKQATSSPTHTETPPPVPPLRLGPLSNNLPISRSADPLLPRSIPKNDVFVAGERIDEEYNSYHNHDHDPVPRPRTRDSGKSFHGNDPQKMPGATRWVDAPTSFGGGGSQPDLATSPRSKVKSPLFSLFSRNRRGTTEGPASLPASPAVLTDAPTLLGREKPMAPKYIGAGGTGIVPQVDAPVSASNAGDRRVVVRCLNSSITLPVNAETTPLEILQSAANLITHKIKPETSLVLESYLQYGLDRRLRRYERIRDVMNSWDRDTLNALVVIPSDMPENDQDLNLASVPRAPESPYSFSIPLYHCPRVGKWQKRVVTLLETGQMYASKKAGAALGGKDTVSLCHLSDFDIYSPTEHQMKKVLKPPKKFCYAVKSQQRSSVFPTGENFVHFFCTDDSAVAKQLHDQVQGWRSWYLVNRKMDLEKAKAGKEAAGQGGAGGSGPRRQSSTKGSGRGARVSIDDAPYAIGTFKPLMDMDVFTKSYDDLPPENAPRQRAASQRHQQQPREAQEAQRKRLSKGSLHQRRHSTSNQSVPGPTPGGGNGGSFDEHGLLGSKYEQRKEEQRLREVALRSQPAADPFTEGPSLLNSVAAPAPHASGSNPALERHTSSSRYRDVAGRQRSTRRPASPTSSVRTAGTTKRPDNLPPPLVDVDAMAASSEPQGWRDEISRNRGGHGVRAPAGVPLVDLATGRSAAHATHKFNPASGTFSSRNRAPSLGAGVRAGTSHGPGPDDGEQVWAREGTLVGQVARSQSTASRAQLGRSMSTASRRSRGGARYTEEAAPPLPAGGTLLAQYEAQQRGRSGTMR
ncbi:uncharacterized protein DNG_08710 [Cephalotrichum gorgonifer]|uniref:Uncharacterized protein n=1 Tax=Cephalotrichum gorgonifer TaxID=2041049 RepID=A0AAE8N430_9PEZI|nr:uncharacterized protein DNG_08710 [Cephalotrichum gorgonifer]